MNTIYTQSTNMVVKEIDEEYVLIPLQHDLQHANKLYTLQHVAAFIWRHIDGTRSLADIADCIVTEYEVSREQAEADLREFVESLGQFIEAKH